MSNDLISREALKKAIEELRRPKAYSEADVRQNVVIDCVLHCIDNAPTVEIATELQPNCNNLQQTQGEWLWLGDNPNPNHKWSCNKCGRGVKEQENFCPNCGLKMRKGGVGNDT